MNSFKFIYSNCIDPFFNIASEEYLLKQTDGFYIYLWQNSPAVIIGNNQNTLLEVNLGYAKNNNVSVVRRLTGGGAVYHDLNNVCYTIIAPFNSSENNYVKFTKPVIDFLDSLGVKATFSGRNDITIGDKKISGNAQVVYKDRIMHHGTLLFNSDLDVLSKVLLENKLKTQSKGIKSNRARVTNIKNHLKKDLTCKEFLSLLCDYFKKHLKEYTFTEKDVESIDKLTKEKYSTYEWNIGKSPIGNNRLDYRFSFGTTTFTFDLVKGKIENAQIYGDFFASGDLSEFSARLNGKYFTYDELFDAFLGIENLIVGASAKEIVDKLFE